MDKKKVIRLTEEQVKRLRLSEDVKIMADRSNGVSVEQAYKKAVQQAKSSGMNTKDVEIVFNVDESVNDYYINESAVFTINDLFKR